LPRLDELTLENDFLEAALACSPGLFNLKPAKMAAWEYRKINLNDLPRRATDLDLLDKAGADDWKLVVITINNIAYLKRHIPKPHVNRKT
jgi:hypothetical protein